MRTVTSQWVAATAWVIGWVAIVCDHCHTSLWLIVVMRTLFVAATSAALCLVLIPKARALAGTGGPELYLFTRLVSRWVYILMYALAAARLALCFYDLIQHGGGSNSAVAFRLPDDFEFYATACIAPLWLIRGLVLALPAPAGGAPSLAGLRRGVP